MKKEFKHFVAGFLSCAVLTCGVSLAVTQFTSIDVVKDNVTIYANGKKVDSPNFTYNDSTYVPLRAVLEKMDCSISYDEETKSVYAENNLTYKELTVADAEPDKSDPVNIKITLKDGRAIEASLYPHVAPKTVENFVNLINKNFYDGLIFHRVINGFMIQGGGFDSSIYDGQMIAKKANAIYGEFAENGFTNNLKHTRGVLSMARTSDPNSASSQFFIMHDDAPHLDGDYAAFGEVTKGMDVVDSIATSKTTSKDVTVEYLGSKYNQYVDSIPEKAVVIKHIEILK